MFFGDLILGEFKQSAPYPKISRGGCFLNQQIHDSDFLLPEQLHNNFLEMKSYVCLLSLFEPEIPNRP